ncbi:MAG: hypothetical protein HYI21_04015 [Sediminibacterium sp. Gen4]|jgi:hypothetical protein|nr:MULTISPECIES: hypothetical protein [unclassified Sediminibacterium]MBW0159761.1 hypothetical protein [Sediminibacterium sp.]MBW0165383.1 hypothetical protein [Sediminibacterium sp.]MDZ4072382.1 hypothetical protein [Sediminibacterium sp.]NWK65172.1 hypothetical protein [Sediminibacterium sp. Gen4]
MKQIGNIYTNILFNLFTNNIHTRLNFNAERCIRQPIVAYDGYIATY